MSEHLKAFWTAAFHLEHHVRRPYNIQFFFWNRKKYSQVQKNFVKLPPLPPILADGVEIFFRILLVHMLSDFDVLEGWVWRRYSFITQKHTVAYNAFLEFWEKKRLLLLCENSHVLFGAKIAQNLVFCGYKYEAKVYVEETCLPYLYSV